MSYTHLHVTATTAPTRAGPADPIRR